MEARRTVASDDAFDEWEENDPEGFLLVEVQEPGRDIIGWPRRF